MEWLSFLIYKLKCAFGRYSAARNIDKLIAKYGCVKAIPFNKRPKVDPEFLTSVLIVGAMNAICSVLKVDVQRTVTGHFIGRGLTGRLVEGSEVRSWELLLNTPNIRQGVYDLLITNQDLLPRFIEVKFAGHGGKASLQAWLNNETDILVTEHTTDNGEN